MNKILVQLVFNPFTQGHFQNLIFKNPGPSLVTFQAHPLQAQPQCTLVFENSANDRYILIKVFQKHFFPEIYFSPHGPLLLRATFFKKLLIFTLKL